MGSNLILDKSALQALSIKELVVLHEKYRLNIVPILLVEIIGDIAKPSAESLPRDIVKELANKVFPYNTAINIHYESMIEASLLGHDVPLKRRPIISGGRNVVNERGEKGIIFKESDEEGMLRRWKDGDFTVDEMIRGGLWRNAARTTDLERWQREMKDTLGTRLPIKDLASLDDLVRGYLRNPAKQGQLLEYALSVFPIEPTDACRIFARWEMAGKPGLFQFCPYALFCTHVNLFFDMALAHGLITTKPTNRVDMQYLYYLPFCNVFCSGDNFHRSVAPFFLGDDQKFIWRDDLKAELQRLSLEVKEKKIAPLAEDKNLTDKMPSEGQRKLVEFINKQLESKPVDADTGLNTDNARFVIKEMKVRLSDPCPCGSGKKMADCHLPIIEASKKKRADGS